MEPSPWAGTRWLFSCWRPDIECLGIDMTELQSFRQQEGWEINKTQSEQLLCVPLLGGLGGDLLQSAAGLLQLGQSVGRGQWRHGWVLDEWLGWLVAT